VIVWFTGLPASGKTTLARVVRDRLASSHSCVLLDSDEMRDVLGAHGYEEAARDRFYAALGRLAVVLARQGHIVLVAATAPRRAYRDNVRREMPGFIEVHVATSAADSEARDPKGLYAKARAGGAPDLPGVGVEYEPPVDPEVTAHGGHDAHAASTVERMVLLMQH
jgi:adenylylsulfate kinase